MATNPDVGTRWEVAIDGVGYMLADEPGGELGYRRLISTLEPQRFAQGATPVSEAIERYSFVNSSEWRGGAGQRFLNREASDQSSYWDAEGVTPFCDCQRLHLLPRVDLKQASSVDDAIAFAGADHLLLRDSGLIEQHTLAGDTVTNGNTHSEAAVEDLSIGYGKGFIATGTSLREITLGSAGASELSALDVHRVEWLGDRLAVLYRNASSRWVFSSLTSAGAEEVTDGLSSYPGATNASMASCQYKLGGITHGPGYCWFTGYTDDGDEGHIYVWNIDTTLAPYIALEMPRGEIPLDVFFYQGGLYIWAVSKNKDRVRIYRCVVNGDGTLTPFLLVDNAGPAPASTVLKGRKFAAEGRFVYFGWNEMDGSNAGLGIIDLSTGGYAKRTQATASGEVRSVFTWGGRPGLTVASRGVYLEHSSNRVTSGWLKTSIYDADSALSKRWDSISWSQEPGANSELDIAYTIDGGENYVTVVTDTTAADGEIALGVEAPTLGLRFELTGDGAGGAEDGSSPYIRVISAKFHPLGILDQILVLPINCADQLKDLKGAIVTRPPDTGAGQARALELLQGNWVTVQDVDWRETQTTQDYEIVQVDIRRWMQAYDPAKAGGRSALVAVVTLRRDVALTDHTPSSNAAPVITNPGAQSGSVGVAITPLQFSATDADADALTWGAAGLPTGLTMSRSGLVSGTPTATGAFSVTVYANDGAGGQDSESLTWTIS